jgi:hypothetical protein
LRKNTTFAKKGLSFLYLLKEYFFLFFKKIFGGFLKRFIFALAKRIVLQTPP